MTEGQANDLITILHSIRRSLGTVIFLLAIIAGIATSCLLGWAYR